MSIFFDKKSAGAKASGRGVFPRLKTFLNCFFLLACAGAFLRFEALFGGGLFLCLFHPSRTHFGALLDKAGKGDFVERGLNVTADLVKHTAEGAAEHVAGAVGAGLLRHQAFVDGNGAVDGGNHL